MKKNIVIIFLLMMLISNVVYSNWHSIARSLIGWVIGGKEIWLTSSIDMNLLRYNLKGTDQEGKNIRVNLAVPKAYFSRLPKKHKSGAYGEAYLEAVLPYMTPETVRLVELRQAVKIKYEKQRKSIKFNGTEKEKEDFSNKLRWEVERLIRNDSVRFWLRPQSPRFSVEDKWKSIFASKKRLEALGKAKNYKGILNEYRIGRVGIPRFYYTPIKQGKYPLYITHSFNGHPDYKLKGSCLAEAQYSDIISYEFLFACERIEEYDEINGKVIKLIDSFIQSSERMEE